jgi:predicted O-linked N-acetylglucosamine transferase (SPINDLY family)
MGGDPSFGRAIERKIKQVRGALWALMSLRGEAVEDRFEPVMQAAAKAYGVDANRLRRAREAPREAYAALIELLDKALDDVDRREVGAKS